MSCDFAALASEAIDSLSPDEREQSVVYIEQRVVPAGEKLSLAGVPRGFDEPVVVAFVDLEPALNWTHRCRYLVLGAEGGILVRVDADRPPFLSRVSPHLRLVHRGAKAPAWAVVTDPTATQEP